MSESENDSVGRALKRKQVGNSSTLTFESLAKEVLDDLVTVREKIGPIATPDYIQNAPGLPKTRSGMSRGL